jgi:hypothetical protein
MIVLGAHDNTPGIVEVAVLTETPMILGGTRPGSEYGMLYDHVVQMRYTINIANLNNVEMPPNPDNRPAYWQYWMNFQIGYNGMQQLAYDTNRVRLPQLEHWTYHE